MAIESIKPVRGTSGTTAGDNIQRRIRYRVKFTTDNEEATAAEFAVASTFGLVLGISHYVYGTTFDPRVRLKELQPTAGKQRREYYVDAIFEGKPPESQKSEPPGEEFPEFPEQAQPFVRVNYRARSAAIAKSLFVGFVDPDGEPKDVTNVMMPPQTKLPITSSAGVPTMPPRESLEYDVALLLTTYVQDHWRKSSEGPGIINSTEVRLLCATSGGAVQFFEDFDARQLLCVSEEWEPHIHYGQPWNTVTREFLYRETGWYVDELDQAVVARAIPGDPDGSGGYFSNSNKTQMELDGTPFCRRLLDPFGNPVTDPVPLNGNGQPLKGNDPADAVFLRWLDFREKNYVSIFASPFRAL